MGEITKKKKNYVKGSAKSHDFSDGGQSINVDINYADLGRLPINAAGYIKITLSRNRQPDAYGNDYSMFENEWKPDPNKTRSFAQAAKNESQVSGRGTPIDDLPFSAY